MEAPGTTVEAQAVNTTMNNVCPYRLLYLGVLILNSILLYFQKSSGKLANFNSRGTYLSCGSVRTQTVKRKPAFKSASLDRTWYYNADSAGRVPHHSIGNDLGRGLRGWILMSLTYLLCCCKLPKIQLLGTFLNRDTAENQSKLTKGINLKC